MSFFSIQAAPTGGMLATSKPVMTTSPSASFPSSFQNKTQFYPNTCTPFLPFPVQATPALPPSTTYHGYNFGCNGTTLTHLPPMSFQAALTPHSTSSGYYAHGMNGHATKYDGLSPVSQKNHHLMPEQLSPSVEPVVDDTHHQRTRINSADDNISPIPASSPSAGPLLSPDATNSHIHTPSSLNSIKTTYNFANGLSNGFTYSGPRPATQHHHSQNNPSTAPPTTGPFIPPHYPTNTCPPVATASLHPVTMPQSMVLNPFYSAHSGPVDYNTPAISSSVNLWNQCYSNPMPKLSYDSPRYKLTPERATPLQKWFDDHKDHPYPTRHDKILLCQETNLTFTQVSTWFANCRRRLKKATQEEEERQNYSSNGLTSNGTGGSDHNQQCTGPNSPRPSDSSPNLHDSDEKLHNYNSKTLTKHTTEEKNSCYTKIGGHRSK